MSDDYHSPASEICVRSGVSVAVLEAGCSYHRDPPSVNVVFSMLRAWQCKPTVSFFYHVYVKIALNDDFQLIKFS